MPDFAAEFAQWVHEYKSQHRTYDLNLTEQAALLGVSPQVLSSWRHGAVPKAETCKRIAETFGVDLDYVLRCAGHPNFTQLNGQISRYLPKWSDGAYIGSTLVMTQTSAWKRSKSFIKENAERMLKDGWKAIEGNERALHAFAQSVADPIWAWFALGAQREKSRESITIPTEAVG